MCLKLTSERARKQIAKEDIVVYKSLKFKMIISQNLSEVKHGDSFKGIIRDTKCEGKISINDNNEVYFCTNEECLDGMYAKDKLGYKYSWKFDERVKKIIANDVLVYGEKPVGYETLYQFAEVKIGETYTSELIKEDEEVNKGLHSYAKRKDAISDSGAITVKCIIPKGSEYYKGDFCSCISYASDTLTYVEIVKC